MRRALSHYRAIHLAVAGAAAVATAVLTGALVVGDSVRGSLRDLTIARLGAIDFALVSERFLRRELAEDLASTAGPDRPVPAILLHGTARTVESGRRASRVQILGVDEGFPGLFDGSPALDLTREPGAPFPQVAVNRAVAAELGVGPGDALLLGFARASPVPRDTLMGERDPGEVVAGLRAVVKLVLPDTGPARFSLEPHQHDPLTALVERGVLERVLDQPGRANAIFLGSRGSADPNALLRAALTLDDLGLVIRRGDGHVVVESRELVLRPAVESAVREAAASLGLPAQAVLAHLANRIAAGERSVPYSIVAAVDPLAGHAWAELRDGTGAAVAPRDDDGIVLNSWAAEDLAIGPGASVLLTYFEVGPREELIEREVELRVDGVAEMTALGADPHLSPEYPGMTEARDIAGWEPPFPVDLGRIRARDETYWDRHRALPKAFVTLARGKTLWTSRFGGATSVRIGVPPSATAEEVEARLLAALVERPGPAAFGLAFRPVKSEGLRASSGATDFAGLFVGFSLFLIASATMLVGLLFSLGVERRAGEVGLLLAVGYPVSRVRRAFLAEGAVVALAGALVGLALAVGYGGAMMAGLRTLWRAAVGSSRLTLHVVPSTLAIGLVVSLAVMLLAVRLRLGILRRIPATRLLSGSFRVAPRLGAARPTKLVAAACVVLALGLVAYAAATGRTDDAALAFGAGVLLLVAGISAFAAWSRSPHGSAPKAASAVVRMAARNSASNPGRSVLSVALVASASFVLVTVAANRRELDSGPTERASGTGGFALVAESTVPVHQDLNRPEDLGELGFDDEERAVISGAHVVPFRFLPGDDASCLNLYRPEKPRVLGVPRELTDRGGFRFAATTGGSSGDASPWHLLSAAEEDGVVPAIADKNSATWILKVGLGEDVVVPDELGRDVRLRLVALLDTSVFQSEILIGEEAFLRHFPGRSGYRYFLIDAPHAQAGIVGETLERRLGSFGFDAVSATERLRSFQVVEHTYLQTFQLLGGLGLLLGTVGLGVVLVRNVLERRSELATLRAIGFPRARVGTLVLAENGFLLVTGVGLGTAAALVAVAPRLATIDVPWGSLVLLLAIVLATGMLASLAAVRGALSTPLLATLKNE